MFALTVMLMPGALWENAAVRITTKGTVFYVRKVSNLLPLTIVVYQDTVVRLTQLRRFLSSSHKVSDWPRYESFSVTFFSTKANSVFHSPEVGK